MKDGLLLVANAVFELNCLHKELTKPDLNPQFHHLCKPLTVERARKEKIVQNLHWKFEIPAKVPVNFLCHFFYGLGHSISWRLYILFNLQGVVLKTFWDAGLKKVVKCTSLTTLSTTGKFKKVHKFIFQSYETLYMYQTDRFFFFFFFFWKRTVPIWSMETPPCQAKK